MGPRTRSSSRKHPGGAAIQSVDGSVSFSLRPRPSSAPPTRSPTSNRRSRRSNGSSSTSPIKSSQKVSKAISGGRQTRTSRKTATASCGDGNGGSGRSQSSSSSESSSYSPSSTASDSSSDSDDALSDVEDSYSPSEPTMDDVEQGNRSSTRGRGRRVRRPHANVSTGPGRRGDAKRQREANDRTKMVRRTRQTLSRPSNDLENASEELSPGVGVITATGEDLVVITENGAKTEHCPSDTWGPFGAEGDNEAEQVLEDLFGENGASKGVRKSRMAPSPLGLILPLLPFQSQFLGWALDQEKGPIRGGILADEMGMGKTIQAIALIMSHRRDDEEEEVEDASGRREEQMHRDRTRPDGKPSRSTDATGDQLPKRKLKLLGAPPSSRGSADRSANTTFETRSSTRQRHISRDAQQKSTMASSTITDADPQDEATLHAETSRTRRGAAQKSGMCTSMNRRKPAASGNAASRSKAKTGDLSTVGKIDHSTGLGLEIRAIDDDEWEAELAHVHSYRSPSSVKTPPTPATHRSFPRAMDTKSGTDRSITERRRNPRRSGDQRGGGDTEASNGLDGNLVMSSVPPTSLSPTKCIGNGGNQMPSGAFRRPWTDATLVLCPVIAMVQWRQEIARCTEPGALRVAIYHGAKRRADAEVLANADVVLSTYSTIESDFRTAILPSKMPCEYCGKKYFPDRLKVHLRFFCGPAAKKSAALAKQRKKRRRRSRPSDDDKEATPNEDWLLKVKNPKKLMTKEKSWKQQTMKRVRRETTGNTSTAGSSKGPFTTIK